MAGIKVEQKYIDFMLPEYNICKVAGSSIGTKATSTGRKNMSIAQKKRAALFPIHENCLRALTKATAAKKIKVRCVELNKIFASIRDAVRFLKDTYGYKGSHGNISNIFNENHPQYKTVCKMHWEKVE